MGNNQQVLEQKLFFIIIDFSDSRAAPDLVKNTKGSSTLVFLQLIVVKTESWALFAVTSNQTLFDDDEKSVFCRQTLSTSKVAALSMRIFSLFQWHP